MERLAALDIGSNTVHVLVGDAGAGGVVEIGHYVETTDLGSEVDRTGLIGSTKLREVLSALRTVLSRARVHGYHDIVAGATAAVRTAADAADLLDRASMLAGGPIRVLDAEREARLTFLGVAGRHAAPGHWLLADIGGGSTELMAATATTMYEWFSLEMGSSTYARRHLSDPPTLDERRHMHALILRQLETLPSSPVDKLVVTGGTASYVVALPGMSPTALRVSRRQLYDVITLLDTRPAAALATTSQLPEARVRSLRAGAQMIAALLELLDLQCFEISHEGVHHGMLLARAIRGANWWR